MPERSAGSPLSCVRDTFGRPRPSARGPEKLWHDLALPLRRISAKPIADNARSIAGSINQSRRTPANAASARCRRQASPRSPSSAAADASRHHRVLGVDRRRMGNGNSSFQVAHFIAGIHVCPPPPPPSPPPNLLPFGRYFPFTFSPFL